MNISELIELARVLNTEENNQIGITQTILLFETFCTPMGLTVRLTPSGPTTRTHSGIIERKRELQGKMLRVGDIPYIYIPDCAGYAIGEEYVYSVIKLIITDQIQEWTGQDVMW